MKTTVEISDPLLEKVRALANRRLTTLRARIEEALRVLVKEASRKPPYRFGDTSFGGEGLQAGIREGDWDAIRDRIYEGRGS